MNPAEAKKLAKQARKAAKGGDAMEAGRLFEAAGEYDDAVQTYLGAGATNLAAATYARAGRYGDAAPLYAQLGQYIVAGEHFERARNFKQAAEAYGQAGRPYRQARATAQAGDWNTASSIFQQLGMPRRAAEVCARAGQSIIAGQLYMRAYEDALKRFKDQPAIAASYATRGLARQSGLLYARAGKIDEAVEVLERAELFSEISEVLREAGDAKRAADYMARSGRLEEAARTLAESGDKSGAERMRAEICLQKGQVLEAISHFERAGEYARAAELHEEQKDFTNAARLFEKAGAHQRAAEAYSAMGDTLKAARAYESAQAWHEAAAEYQKSGDAAKATEMFEKAGAKFEVGKAYFDRGLFDQAIRALQAIEAGEPDFAAGKAMLGDIFREKGMHSLAIKNYQLSVGDNEVRQDNIPVYYQMAICLEKEGQYNKALNIYDQILTADYHFRDVSQRVNEVKKLMQSRPATPSAPLATSGGIGAGITGSGSSAGRFDATVYQGDQQAPTQAAQRRYVVESELGRGGMGIVYKARDTMLDRTIALKVLPPAFKTHPQALDNFMREAKSAAALNHPNIVTVYDVGEEAGDTYISMEYVEGRTIKELLVEDGRIPYKAALVIAGQICKAMQYAHENNVIHRDIKPSNIMWTDKKEVKIMDFGLAKILKDVTNQTTRVAGTPYYMSPEQTTGEGVDHRTDLYALGVTLFEMVTGELPFPEGDIAYHHVHTPPPSVKQYVPEIPDDFADVVLKLMAKNKDARYQSADEVFEALKKAVSGK
ncbi:MAG: protein kinase [Chrysiogenetes bacterium]|nr:protein kinase [Chrysiogenetes bacterium]